MSSFFLSWYTNLMKNVFLSATILLSIFLVSRYIFEPTYLYYEFVWLDIPMHIIGGAAVTFFIASVATFLGQKPSVYYYFALYLAVAGLWETYEYMRGIVVYDALWKYFDSIQDVINGGLGALFTIALLKK